MLHGSPIRCEVSAVNMRWTKNCVSQTIESIKIRFLAVDMRGGSGWRPLPVTRQPVANAPLDLGKQSGTRQNSEHFYDVLLLSNQSHAPVLITDNTRDRQLHGRRLMPAQPRTSPALRDLGPVTQAHTRTPYLYQNSIYRFAVPHLSTSTSNSLFHLPFLPLPHSHFPTSSWPTTT